MDSDEVLRTCGAYFAGRPDVRLALVYGSAARGALQAHSDVDLAVLGGAPLGFDTMLAMRLELESTLGREVDLIDLAKVDGLIYHRAVTGGKVVKKDAPLFAECLIRALDFNEDFLPYLRRIRNAKIARFIDGS
jgi:predicted nucleotidyltransferase